MRAASSTLSCLAFSFKYDPFGRRIEKISPTTTSIFAYDGPNLIETVNSTGEGVARYTQTENVDEPLAMQRGSTTSYYEADGLGSITSLSSSAGVLVNTVTRTTRSATLQTPSGQDLMMLNDPSPRRELPP
jgi:hypothetical protein